MSRSSIAQLWLATGFWLLFATPVLLQAAGHGVTLSDTDAAMRLAEVRDLLHGQSWFDTTQWRMNVPFGLPMHWSRLVDAPIAALISLSGSETFALTVWPLFLLFAVLVALARIAEALGGRIAVLAVLVLALMGAEVDGLFAAGDIDHHNVQVALMLWMLAFLIEQRPRAAAVMLALGLGVGMESLPYAVAAIIVAALWLKREPTKAGAFGAALAATALALLCATTAARYRASPACDTYSLFYAVLLAAGGAGLAGIARLPRHRLAAFAALALGVAALGALVNPSCLSGPYGGIGAAMRAVWLSRINEAKPALLFAVFAPSEFIGAYLYAAFALAACWFAPPGRSRTLVMAFAVMALAVTTLQIRGAAFAMMFALPGLAAALARLPLGPLSLGLLLGSDVSFAFAGSLIEGPARQSARVDAFLRQVGCASEAAMVPLKALPPGRVAAFVDQGPAILIHTGDAVLAGPYHRDAAGILDTYAIFAGPDPRAILKARGIDYVMTCSAAPDWGFYRARGGLVAQLAAGREPHWLVPAGTAGDVAVWRLVKN